jgi:hypothetical protein
MVTPARTARGEGDRDRDGGCGQIEHRDQQLVTADPAGAGRPRQARRREQHDARCIRRTDRRVVFGSPRRSRQHDSRPAVPLCD